MTAPAGGLALGRLGGRAGDVVRPLSADRVTRALAFLVLGTVAAWALAPSLFASSPAAIDPNAVLAGPSLHHLLGTDQLGRDVLGEIIYGTRQSLAIGVISVAAGGTVGTVFGIAGGYIGGAADMAALRTVDVLMCFPGILLALIFEAAMGPSLTSEMVAVSVASVPTFARLARGQALALRTRPFIGAARISGVREPVIVARHVLPNLLAPLISMATIGLGAAIVLGAALSFLGLGPQGGLPDWGSLLGSGENFLSTAWWVATFPGLAITLVVIATSVLGDWLQDRLDPGRRARR
jgi:peptide/nickel transport system permease protein